VTPLSRRRRHSIRTRLAARYAVVAFVTGALLLGFSYAVVRHELGPSTSAGIVATRAVPSVAARTTTAARPAPTARRSPSSLEPPTPSAVRVIQAVRTRDAAGLRNVLLAFGGALLLMTVVSAWIGWALAGRALAPVARITAAARRVSGSNLDERISLGGPADELRELADTFDGMLDDLDEAFASERRFVANASHELRTPLTVIRTAIDVAEDGGGFDERTAATVTVIRRALAGAEELVERLLVLARSHRGLDVRTAVDLGAVLRDAMTERAGSAQSAGLDVRLDVPEHGPTVAGDVVLLRTLAGNLVDNAVGYNRPGGAVQAGARVDGDAVELWVRNDGPVVPPGAVDALRRPFRRAAERTGQRGSGLGLSIVDAVARAHDGTVTLRARPAGGLEVVVRLPPPSDG
jgi:signal transduction histidine kinase